VIQFAVGLQICFSSGTADIALRLGPEIGISRLTDLKTQQETQWFLRDEGKSTQNTDQTKPKRQNLRFATKNHSETTKEPGPEPNTDQTQIDLPLDTIELTHRVSK